MSFTDILFNAASGGIAYGNLDEQLQVVGDNSFHGVDEYTTS